MAVAFVQGGGDKSATDVTSRTITLSNTVTDNYIVVCATAFAFNDAPDLTPSGTGLTFTSQENVLLTSYFRLQIWTARITAGQSSHVITMALAGGAGTGGGGTIAWSASECSGVDLSTPVAHHLNNSGSGTTFTTGTLTVAANSLVVACCFQDTGSNKTLTPDATNWPATAIYENETASAGPIFGSYYKTGSANVNAEVDSSGSGTWRMAGIVLAPSSPGVTVSASVLGLTASLPAATATGAANVAGSILALTASIPAFQVDDGTRTHNTYRLETEPIHNRMIRKGASLAPYFPMVMTVWEMVYRTTTAEVDSIIASALTAGCTGIACVCISEIEGPEGVNSNGDKIFTTHSWTDAEASATAAFWSHVDYIVNACAANGLYCHLLPTWGKYVGEDVNYAYFSPGAHTGQPADLAAAKARAYSYGHFLGKRYKDKPVVWVLGGDIDDSDIWTNMRQVWDEMSEGIEDGIDAALYSSSDCFLTYHPGGPSYTTGAFHTRTNDNGTQWLDVHGHQSAHLRYDEPLTYAAAETHYARTSPVKPFMEMEAAYLDHPRGTNDNDPPVQDGRFHDYDVRLHFFWSTFQGGAGYWFSTGGLWQLYASGRTGVGSPLNYWTVEIAESGVQNLKYVRWLLDGLLADEDIVNRQAFPDATIIPSQASINQHHKIACGDTVDGSASSCTWAMIYFPASGFNPETDSWAGSHTVAVDLTQFITGSTVRAWWYNPRTGAGSSATDGSPGPTSGNEYTRQSTSFTKPANAGEFTHTYDRGNDAVLILSRTNNGHFEDPSFSGNSTVAAGVLALTASLPSHTIQTGAIVAGSVEALTGSLPAPGVAAGANVAASIEALTASLPTPAVQTGAIVAGSIEDLTATLPARNVATGAIVAASIEGLTASLQAPTVVGSVLISASVLNLYILTSTDFTLTISPQGFLHCVADGAFDALYSWDFGEDGPTFAHPWRGTTQKLGRDQTGPLAVYRYTTSGTKTVSLNGTSQDIEYTPPTLTDQTYETDEQFETILAWVNGGNNRRAILRRGGIYPCDAMTTWNSGTNQHVVAEAGGGAKPVVRVHASISRIINVNCRHNGSVTSGRLFENIVFDGNGLVDCFFFAWDDTATNNLGIDPVFEYVYFVGCEFIGCLAQAVTWNELALFAQYCGLWDCHTDLGTEVVASLMYLNAEKNLFILGCDYVGGVAGTPTHDHCIYTNVMLEFLVRWCTFGPGSMGQGINNNVPSNIGFVTARRHLFDGIFITGCCHGIDNGNGDNNPAVSNFDEQIISDVKFDLPDVGVGGQESHAVTYTCCQRLVIHDCNFAAQAAELATDSGASVETITGYDNIADDARLNNSSAPSSLDGLPDPTILTGAAIAGSVETLTASLPAATVQAGNAVTVPGSVLVLVTSLPAPTAVTSATISPSVLVLTTSLAAATVEAGNEVVVPGSVMVLSASMPTPTVQTAAMIAATVIVLTASLPSISVTTGSSKFGWIWLLNDCPTL